MLLKNTIIFSFDFVRHTSCEIVCLIILRFPPSVKIIPNSLMSNFLIIHFFSFVLIDCFSRIL